MTNNQDINYYETVAVPVLQRKCQELFNTNMVLETSLHMEVTKARSILEDLAKSKANQTASGAELESLRTELEGAKQNANNLNNAYATAEARANDLQRGLDALHQRAIHAESQVQNLSSNAQSTDKTIAFLQSELHSSRLQVEALQNELLTLKQELKVTQDKLSSMAAIPVSKPVTRQAKVKVLDPKDDF